jgi:hypothetical protein
MRGDASLVDTSHYSEMTRNDDEGNRTTPVITANAATPGTTISAS